MTVAFTDGRRLYAARYATDDAAPTLYHRWSETRAGRAVVSEPLDAGQCWEPIPPGSFCTFEGTEVRVETFAPRCRSRGTSRRNRAA